MSARVLVIDDEPHVTQVMKTFFARANFEVDVATNGEEGRALFAAHAPDAVITDFEMPLVNGRELIESLLADEQKSPRVIVLVTSRTDAELREWVAGMERVDFVEKPASPRRLVRFVESRLGKPQIKAVS